MDLLYALHKLGKRNMSYLIIALNELSDTKIFIHLHNVARVSIYTIHVTEFVTEYRAQEKSSS